MGKRGPAKTPTRVLKLRGSWLAPTRTGEPEPPPLGSTCPEWLRPLAKDAWKILCEQLGSLGLLGTVDENTLARYCQTYSKWREAEDFIAENGQTYEAMEGPKVHPMSTLAIKYGEQLTRLEGQFGMTPSSRANLAKPKDATGSKDKFFGDSA